MCNLLLLLISLTTVPEKDLATKLLTRFFLSFVLSVALVLTIYHAEFAKRVVEENNLSVSKALIVCKSFHAKRCLLLYQMYFPNVDFTVVTFDGFSISKDNWYQTEYGRERVMGEIKKIEEQCK